MFISPYYRTIKGSRRAYWALVESFRSERGSRQRVVAWLALELIKTLKLDEFLKNPLPSGREDVPWSVTALVLIIARLCEPSSELSIAENFYRKTVLSDLLGVPEEKIYDNRLYRALDQLLPHKEKLETHLKNRLGELFDLEYDLLLYDVTSTYFEGEVHEIRKRCITKPSEHQAILLHQLGLQQRSRLKTFEM